MSSIDHGHESEPADAPAEQIAVDGSVGSDTDAGEAFKSDAASKDGPDSQTHHARSNSLKKPTTFKAVSVTKNFLAKAGTPTTPAAKTNGENAPATPGSILPPAPRPRLVAKTASGTQGTGAIKATFGAKNGATGPDPMQVWNRNRAAPQPAQKHFTDEELKQQYGIHLATRLQADSDGKEAKWADIDDDEDDWAPEAIEWNDGTKIELSQSNTAAALAAEKAEADAAREREEEENKSKIALQKPTTTVGPNATVLKPRSAAQPKGGGLVLKTPSEKPSLVSKPSAPTPVRSPWASLPPVDKVPPIEINPQFQDSPSRTQQHDAYPNAYPNQPTQSPHPAVEIAADDFSRNRRDAPNGNPGQLFNAQSGRYEPANTGRRGSMRKEQNFRPPSLLQRGSTNDTRGPAEPSSAFQTRTGSQQDSAPWTRRRSSNVSGDSGAQARRLSLSKGMPNGLNDERRGSQHSQAIQSPTTPAFGQGSIPRDGSPAQQHPLSAMQSPAMQHAQMADPRSGTGSPTHTREENIAAQKQLMKEKRELAIKRKKEEEEREEAAKKERIRARMEALGMPPLEDKEDKEDSGRTEVQKSIEKRPVEVPKPERPSATTQGQVQASTQSQEAKVTAPKSPPPKPPLPDASGVPQQYGMMKVHGAPTNNVSQLDGERLHMEKTRPQISGPKISPPSLQPRPTQSDRMPSPLVNGIKHAEPSVAKGSDFANQHQNHEQPRQQPWNQIPNDQRALAGAGWGSQTATRDPSSKHSNVWGVPNQSRSLGNGAFDRSVQRPQSRQQDQFASPALAPIGPPKHLQSSRESREATRGSDVGREIAKEDFQSIPSFPPTEVPAKIGRHDTTGRHMNQDHMPTAPHLVNGLQPRPQVSPMDSTLRASDTQQSNLAAWGNFHSTTTQEEAIKRQQHAAKLAEESRQGIRHEPQLPVMTETWRQVKIDENSTQRSIIGVTKAQQAPGQFPGPQMNADIRSTTFGAPTNTVSSIPAGIGRGSRFFPAAGRGVGAHIYARPPPFAPGHRRGSSPPPPDSESHPAFVGDSKLPRVNLPFVALKPKVKLPPSMTAPVQSTRMADVQPVPLAAASQPLVSNSLWQDRFNGLLGVKKTSPELTYASSLAPEVSGYSSIFSASKEPLLAPIMFADPAAVSLPHMSPASAIPTFSAESKNVADEEDLFVPQAGSLPLTQLPPKEPTGPWGIAKVSKRGAPKPTRSSKEVEPVSKESLVEMAMMSNGAPMIFIRLKGMNTPKSKTMASKSNGPNNYSRTEQQQRPRNFSGGPKPQGKTFKSRQSSGNINPNSPRAGQSLSKNSPHTSNRTPSGAAGWDTSYVR